MHVIDETQESLDPLLMGCNTCRPVFQALSRELGWFMFSTYIIQGLLSSLSASAMTNELQSWPQTPPTRSTPPDASKTPWPCLQAAPASQIRPAFNICTMHPFGAAGSSLTTCADPRSVAWGAPPPPPSRLARCCAEGTSSVNEARTRSSNGYSSMQPPPVACVGTRFKQTAEPRSDQI